jgi:hypothetical protein
MIVDLVLETGIAFGVSTGLPLQNDRAAVGEDEARPDQQRARLPEGDLTVVDADQFRSLRNEKIAPGWAVVDVLGDLPGDLAGRSERMPVKRAAGITDPA